MDYVKYTRMGYEKFLGMVYKKFLEMGYEKFFGIFGNIFTRFSCERFLCISADFWVRFLGISADFLQNCYLRTDFAAEKAWLISRVQDRVATFPFKASVKGESNPAASLINLRLKLRIPRNRWRPFLSTGQGEADMTSECFSRGTQPLEETLMPW